MKLRKRGYVGTTGTKADRKANGCFGQDKKISGNEEPDRKDVKVLFR